METGTDVLSRDITVNPARAVLRWGYSSAPPSSSSFALVATSSISGSSSFSFRQSSSFSYKRLTGRSLIGPFGPRSASLRGGLRLFFGGASGPKLRLLGPPGVLVSGGRGAQPLGRGAPNPPAP